jgi:hypothetical protein
VGSHALAFGFDYSPTSLSAAVSAMRAGGATHLSWLLHPNLVPTYGQHLEDLGVRVHSGSPDPQRERPARSAGLAPELSATSEVDLRYLIHREGSFAHEWESSLALERLRAHVFALLHEIGPDVVLFGDVPHGAASYLLYRLAEHLGIPRLVVRYGPTPFHVNVVEDIDRRLLDVVSAHGQPAQGMNESSEQYVQLLTGTYRTAEPAYNKDAASIGARLRAKLRAHTVPLDRRLVRTVYQREVLRRRYERRAVPGGRIEQIGGRTAVVYLHLQPERTTTPEGGRFAQQWLMVQALRAALPPDFTILVREHPSTFVRGARLVRSTAFYDSLVELPNTHLLSTRIPSFDVVDRASFVVTVTGTVGFEAAARGTASIVFGNAAYRGCAGVLDGDDPTWRAPDGPQRAATVGLPLEDFLARFDASDRTYVAPWSADFDVRELRTSGRAYQATLPQALAGRR